ncbi:MAG: DNA repair protein RecO (recombination protein O) [Hyphomicrobiaceae bacterium]|jgi:DNA repair protein RecO (recombination protein O)
MEEFRATGYVMRKRPFGESDLIVTLLTVEQGKRRSIAKGARRSKKRFAGGALEPFQELSLRLAKRENRGLDFLHESRVVRSNARVASNLLAFAWASYLTEITDAMTVDDDPCPEIVLAYGATLNRIVEDDPAPAAHHYLLQLLDHAGWAPDFGHCGICAEPVTAYARPVLDHRGSGIVCGAHEAERNGIDATDPTWRPSRRVIDEDLLTYIRTSREAVVEDASPECSILGSALLDRLLDLHLARPPKSRAFLAGLREPLPKVKGPT